MSTPSAALTAVSVNHADSPSGEPTAKADSTPNPSEIPGSADTSAPKPSSTSKPKPQQLCTLTILGKQIKVKDNVDEATLKKTHGWLTSSALPGEEGMCVVYGHRNRNHLRVLKDVEYGDSITVTMRDGAIYRYVVTNIAVFESTDGLRLPTADSAELTLITCYPFRYTGNAPGKYLVRAKLIK